MQTIDQSTESDPRCKLTLLQRMPYMLKGSPSSSEDADRLQFLWKEVQSLVSTSWTNAFESRLELISLATSFFVTPEHVLPEDLDRLPRA